MSSAHICMGTVSNLPTWQLEAQMELPGVDPWQSCCDVQLLHWDVTPMQKLCNPTLCCVRWLSAGAMQLQECPGVWVCLLSWTPWRWWPLGQ